MKQFLSILIIIHLLIIGYKDIIAQPCTECACGTQPSLGFDPNPNEFRGGFFKPATSNIGGATQGEDEFPVLIVFVQFQNEPGDSTTTNPDMWPARRPPNYIDSLIAPERQSSSNWWDTYNGYAISDFWHEFSRGKLHVKGRAISIILSHEINWYADSGIAKVNREIYNILIDSLGRNWRTFDQWKYISDGVFSATKDSLVDMIYTVFRQRENFLFGGGFWGLASLGDCNGAEDYSYTVYDSSVNVVKIFGPPTSEAISKQGSGVRVFADGLSKFSRQTFLDIATHEHAHYLFLFNHKPHGKMQGVGYGSWEFSLSPWEVIKLGYIKPKFVNYSYSTNLLYDYSSRGDTAGTTGEVLMIPINSDTTEFFLISNRRKVSQWDRRMSGDTLADDRWQDLKNINEDYGKGLYIYHVKNGFLFDLIAQNDIDLECADGLWNWDSAGISRKRINSLQFAAVIKKNYPYYNNDNPDSGYQIGKDEMSKSIIFSPGSQDNFSTNPIGRGTHSIYTNDNDYWYSMASNGDRWDAWNVGYNVIFSPYSSPNTKDMLNNQTGIFIYYKSLNSSTNEAQLEIFRAGYGGKTEDQILEITPPSRPMGLRVLECDSTPSISGFPRIKLRWFHNMEPDMDVNGSKKYKIYCDTAVNMGFVPYDAMQYPQNYYRHIATVNIATNSIPEYIDSLKISTCYNAGVNYSKYPVRYRVQAVDKYNDESVLSDFAKTEAWTTINGGQGSDNMAINETISTPKDYCLKQNYPNPFNPLTIIQYDLPEDNFVMINIYDILGKEVFKLVNEFKFAGSYIVSYDFSDFSSGVYFHELSAGNFREIRKMTLIK